jgi:hypothetical protein
MFLSSRAQSLRTKRPIKKYSLPLSTRLFNIIFIHSAKQNDSFNPQLSQLFPVDLVDFAD